MAEVKEKITVEQIVGAIRAMGSDKATCSSIQARLGLSSKEYRVVDRALQRARKAGAIRFDAKRGWLATQAG